MSFRPRPESVLTSVIRILHYHSICCLAAHQIQHYYLKQNRKQNRQTSVGCWISNFWARSSERLKGCNTWCPSPWPAGNPVLGTYAPCIVNRKI